MNQIQKNESMIGNVVEAIASAKLVAEPVPPQGEDSMDLQVLLQLLLLLLIHSFINYYYFY